MQSISDVGPLDSVTHHYHARLNGQLPYSWYIFRAPSLVDHRDTIPPHRNPKTSREIPFSGSPRFSPHDTVAVDR